MITDKGFIVPTIDEIYTRKLNDFKSVKPDLRETDSNIIIAWLRFDSAEEYDSYLQALSAFNQLSVYTATGSNLNAITSHLAMTWNKPKKAVGKIAVTAEIGTQIPQAWGVETKSGVKFVTLNTSAITTIERETDIEVIALNAGTDGNVSAGAITEQTEILTGVISINNKLNTLGGRDLETDTELRERYLKRLDRKSSFTTEGIKNYILQNTNVQKCQVIENDTDDFDSDGRLAHSYECICYGDTNDNILKVLYEYKIAGIRTVGDITKNFGEITVGFTRPTEKTIYLKVEVEAVKEIWKDDFKKVIKDIYLRYLDEVEPAGTIYLYKLIGEIYKNTSGIKTLKLKLGDVKYSEREADYKLSTKEVAVANENDITIEVNQ
ncbi:baseplate J/gp47 family protein [Fusobacterium nucleatum]|uniref:baseplate J/gp47 family protein n=1 Tax=Fusobacterium nucleatum TaxID=851 RepID=UPI0030D0CABF